MPGVSELRLEPMTEAHLDDLEELLGDPEVLRFTRLPDPALPGYSVEWYGRYQAARQKGTAEVFAAVAPDESFLGVALAPQSTPRPARWNWATWSPRPPVAAARAPRCCGS